MIFDLERYNITCPPLMVSCYAVLGLQLDASIAEIRAAYKRRALEVHPDKGGSSAEFQLVLAAFEQFRGQKITKGWSLVTFHWKNLYVGLLREKTSWTSELVISKWKGMSLQNQKKDPFFHPSILCWIERRWAKTVELIQNLMSSPRSQRHPFQILQADWSCASQRLRHKRRKASKATSFKVQNGSWMFWMFFWANFRAS